MDVIQTTLRIPRILQKSLKEKAEQQGLTRNALILQILWEWANKNQKTA